MGLILSLTLSVVLQVKKLVYVYLVRYAEEQQDLALLSISTFQRGLKVKKYCFKLQNVLPSLPAGLYDEHDQSISMRAAAALVYSTCGVNLACFCRILIS